MSITIAGLWREGRDLAETHAATVVPIAAAFMFLPQLISAVVVGPQEGQAADFGGGNLVAGLITAVLAFIGQAAIAAIMLGGPAGPRDVADALRRGGGLVPRLLLVVLMLVAIALPVVFIASLILVLFIGPGQIGDAATVQRVAGMIVLPILLIAAYVGGRLFLLFPVLVAEGAGARATLTRTWRLTGERQWTLIGFMLSALVAIIFLTVVVNMVAGGLFGLLLGPGSRLGFLLTTTFATLIATAIGLIGIGASVVAYRALAR